MQLPKLDKKGFTLIELLVVIAVLGILAAVVLVAINPAKRLQSARDSGVKSDIGQLATAIETYYTNNNGSYPAALTDLTPNELKNVPTPPAGRGKDCTGSTTGSAGYQYSTSTGGEAAVYCVLENPAVATVNTYCYRSAVGKAVEATSCTP